MGPMAESEQIRRRIVMLARAEIGVREVGRNNRGARVEEYQRAAGARPGSPWCACFAAWVLSHIQAVPIPRVTSGVARTWRGWPPTWRLAPEHARAVLPGDLACYARTTTTTPARDAARIRGGAILLAHMGVVVACDADGYDTVEGNVQVSRERPRGGVAVRRHAWTEPGLVGWLQTIKTEAEA